MLAAPGRRALPSVAAAFFAAAVALGLGLFLLSVTHLPFTGDEPGYLIQAESLWNDGDLDLTNNVGAGTPLGAVTPNTRPSTLVEVDGAMVPVQPPGLPLLLLPAVVLARSPRAEVLLARLTIAAFAAGGAALLVVALARLRPGRSLPALLLVVAATASLAGAPWVVLIYPEAVAAFCVTVVLHAAVLRYRGSALISAAALAALPWLSVRFLLLGALLVLLGALAPRRDQEEPPAARALALPLRGAARALPVPLRGAARALGVPLRGAARALARDQVVIPGLGLGLSLVGLAAYSKLTYGSWNPAAVYDAFSGGYRPTGLTRYRVGVGSLLSRTEGLFVVLPLTWLALLGVGRLLHRHLVVTVAGGLVIAAYLLVVLPSGARGASPPPRLVVALVPLVVAGVWIGASRSRTYLACLVAAVLLGLATSAVHLAGRESALALYGDHRPVRVAGQVPLFPRMDAALGTEGPSVLPAGSAGAGAGWGPFQVVGGAWVVRAADAVGLPDGLVVRWAPQRGGPYRPLGVALADEPGARAFSVPGYEAWLEAVAPEVPSAARLEFQAVRPRTREGVVVADGWRSALLVGLGALVVATGYTASARAARADAGPIGATAPRRSSPRAGGRPASRRAARRSSRR